MAIRKYTNRDRANSLILKLKDIGTELKMASCNQYYQVDKGTKVKTLKQGTQEHIAPELNSHIVEALRHIAAAMMTFKKQITVKSLFAGGLR